MNVCSSVLFFCILFIQLILLLLVTFNTIVIIEVKQEFEAFEQFLPFVLNLTKFKDIQTLSKQIVDLFELIWAILSSFYQK